MKQDNQEGKKSDIRQNSEGEENFDVEILPESQNKKAAAVYETETSFSKSINLENLAIKKHSSLTMALDMKQDNQEGKKLDGRQNIEGEENFDVEILPESQNKKVADE